MARFPVSSVEYLMAVRHEGSREDISEEIPDINHEDNVFTGNTNIRNSANLRQQDECTPIEHPFFPLCNDKFESTKHFWKEDQCLVDKYQMNGSKCSIYNYLTNVEPFCAGKKDQYKVQSITYATPRFGLDGLLKLLGEESLEWMRQRAKFIWPNWLEAGKKFLLKKPINRNINVIVLFATFKYEPVFLNNAFTGGPLGELIQWTDLVTGLYILGYNITVTKTPEDLSPWIIGNDKNDCVVLNNYKEKVDVIYTDITGLFLLDIAFGISATSKYRCMFRVLDSFGTDPEYNYYGYPHEIPGGTSPYGERELLLSQFLNLYPHTQDNNFIGFAVSNMKINSSRVESKKDIALIYAKRSSYFIGNERYLQIVSEYFSMYATCVDEANVPNYITNHGPVSSLEVQRLLSLSKVFIGVGFPYEGPGPLEAMAAGCVFLQPKFDVPINKLNTNFFDTKPTLRYLTSQNPYMEEYVKEPYCYTINVTDEVVLRRTLINIKRMERLPGKVPKEFTHEGMMERIYTFTDHIDYCNPYAPRWPPLDNMQVYFSLDGESCKDCCMSKGLVCERTYFSEINSVSSLEMYANARCDHINVTDFAHAPSHNSPTNECYIQTHGQLFSCMHREKEVKRLCPCRDYEFEQTAICRNCL